MRRILVAAAAALLCNPTPAAEQAMIVLDASGSMWGKIDGKPKIESARETLRKVLTSVPKDLALGLIAYGHRRKGDCNDIELLVPPAVNTGTAVAAAANILQPKGKTPLSAAVLQAAEDLKYTEDKATVILITDGLETCSQDPCALGTRLAQTGVDFTAHVVGFGLSDEEGRQVACLAENTGGMYLPAADAGQLSAALAETVAAVTEPEPAPEPEAPPAPAATLTADQTVEQAAPLTVTWEGPGGRYDSIQIFDPSARGGEGKVMRTATIAYGDIEQHQVTLAAPAKLGAFELRYWDGTGRRVIATRPFEVIETQVALSGPETVEIGRPILVEWQGPGARYDNVRIFDPSALNGEGKVVRQKRLRNDDFEHHKVTLPAPAKVGEYELQYWNGENKTILARRPIRVVEAEVALSAADSVEAGRNIVVEWVGPGGQYDNVQIFDPSALNGEGKVIRQKRLRNEDFENHRASFPAPAKAGGYELRYWNGDNKAVLATRPITVTAAEVSLSAPETIPLAATIPVEWQGPGGRYDSVQLFDPAATNGKGKVIRQKRLRNDDFDNHRASLPAPAKPGAYELRYWNGDNRVVLATRAITVTQTEVSLSGPDKVSAGQSFVVEWLGPGARYDELQILDTGGKTVGRRRLRSDQFEERKASLKAPKSPGQYQLRYWNGDNRAVLATRPLTVE